MQKKRINENLAVNAIRVLAATAITKAKSGHPGIALGAAPIMYELMANQINVSPTYHDYYNRDRFVLSAGHASSLLYATMLVCGYDNITMDDLMNFRQIDSKTAGHPEPHLLNNVEICSGPLGQGIAMAVGFAIASKKAANLVNCPGTKLIDNYTYCLFGDGCFQEGISYEAIAIAGRLKLNKLIMIYDYNKIQLDGRVEDSTEIKTRSYFRSMGWNVISATQDLLSIRKAINRAKKSLLKPTVILCHTNIGYGSAMVNTNKIHGTPLDADGIALLKKNLKFDYPDFVIPPSLNSLPRYVNERVEKKIVEFNNKLLKLEKENIQLYNQVIDLIVKHKYNFDLSWFDPATFPAKEATRNIAGTVLQTIAKHNPALITSIADLSSSTKIGISGSKHITARNFEGQNLDCGVREFAMGAIDNAINVFGGIRAMGSTFMSFSDYNKPAIRLAAISGSPSINVYSHDSITVGEDGPTHQPIEQLWSLRLIPNHFVFRPTSTMDMIVAYEWALKSKNTPCSIITSRSAFNQINVDYETAKRGGYVVANTSKNGRYTLTIYATGSEIELAINVANKLDCGVRVVAINSLELLMQQDKEYLDTIFDSSKKVSIEFGSTAPWYKYVDLAIGVDQFGLSGKPNDVIKRLGLTTEQIVKKINNWMK